MLVLLAWFRAFNHFCYLFRKEAEFFHLCEENGSAILAVISSMQSLSLSASENPVGTPPQWDNGEHYWQLSGSLLYKVWLVSLKVVLIENEGWLSTWVEIIRTSVLNCLAVSNASLWAKTVLKFMWTACHVKTEADILMTYFSNKWTRGWLGFLLPQQTSFCARSLNAQLAMQLQ